MQGIQAETTAAVKAIAQIAEVVRAINDHQTRSPAPSRSRRRPASEPPRRPLLRRRRQHAARREQGRTPRRQTSILPACPQELDNLSLIQPPTNFIMFRHRRSAPAMSAPRPGARSRHTPTVPSILLDQVGVTVVPGVLLDEVVQDAAQRVLVAGPAVDAGDVEGRRGGFDVAGDRDLGLPGREGLLRRRVDRVVGDLEVASGDQTSGTSCPSSTRRNQARSTSAMWRTRLSSVSEDGVVRRRRSSSESPAHFSARVSRWKSR